MADIFSFTSYSEYLKAHYEEKKRRSRTFSHRYVGMKIGFSAGYFSRILSGEKQISAEMVEKFVQFLELKPRESDYFRHLVGYSQAKAVETKQHHYQKMLSLRHRKLQTAEKLSFDFFSHWSNSVVFSLCKVAQIGPQSDFAALGKRFTPKLSAEEIRKSLDLLVKLDLIYLTDSAIYAVKNSFLSSIGDESIQIRNFLSNSISGAAAALDTVPREEREIQTMMVSVSEAGYAKIRDKMAAFRAEINEIVAHESTVDRICQINFHLFPRYKQ